VVRASDVRTISLSSLLFASGECENEDPRWPFGVQDALPADPFTGELPFTIPVPEPIYVGIAP
jgi:hypothetical protein